MPERVRADDVAVVRREIPARLTLAGEDREVVLPEVDHDFLELPLAHHRSRDAGRGQLGHELVRAPRLLQQLHRVGERRPTGPLHRVTPRGGAKQRGRWELLVQVGRAQRQRLVARRETASVAASLMRSG